MGPGWTSSSGVLCSCRSESVRNRYSGVFEDAKHEYDNAEGIRGTWGPDKYEEQDESSESREEDMEEENLDD